MDRIVDIRVFQAFLLKLFNNIRGTELAKKRLLNKLLSEVLV